MEACAAAGALTTPGYSLWRSPAFALPNRDHPKLIQKRLRTLAKPPGVLKVGPHSGDLPGLHLGYPKPWPVRVTCSKGGLTPSSPATPASLLLFRRASVQPQGLCTCGRGRKNSFLCLGAPPSYPGLMGLPPLASCVRPHPFSSPAVYFLSNTCHQVTFYYICTGLGFSVCLPCEDLNALKTQAQ